MNQQTDKIIRQKLLDAEQAYPAGLWEQIAPQIPEYQTGRTRRWKPVLLFAALGLALAFWFGKGVINIEENANPQHHTAGFEANSPLKSSNQENTLAPVNQEQMSEATSIVAEDQTALQRDNVHAIHQSNADLQGMDRTGQTLGEAITGETRPLSPAQAFSEKTAIPARPGEPKPAIPVLFQKGNTNHFAGTSTTRAKLPAISRLKSKYPDVSLLNHKQRVLEIDGIGPDPDCYSFGKRHQSNFTIDVYTGLGIALRPMSSADEDVTNYIDARQETESFKYLFTFGARINLMMNNGLAFRGGLHYTQIGEKFDYTDTSAVRIITIIDTTFVGGDTIVNTSQEIQEGTLIKKINNRFHSIDIPLLIGYDVPLGRMQASVSAGPVLNISAWQRGQFLSPSLEPVSIETESPNYYPAYKTSLGIGVYLSAALAVPITENMWLFGEPYMLHRFNPVTLEEYSIRQRNTNVGLNVGLKLKI